MVTPSTLSPALAKNRTATVSACPTAIGGLKSNVIVWGPPPLIVVCWNVGAYGTGETIERFQISMMGEPWYATLSWWRVEPAGTGSDALMRLAAVSGCTPVMSWYTRPLPPPSNVASVSKAKASRGRYVSAGFTAPSADGVASALTNAAERVPANAAGTPGRAATAAAAPAAAPSPAKARRE